MSEAMTDPLPTPEPETLPPRAFGAGPPSAFAPPRPWKRRMQIAGWAVAALLALLMILIAWLAVTAPLSRSLKPIAPPSISLLSADSHLIARPGAIIARPGTAAAMPDHVTPAFMAKGDRRASGKETGRDN